MKATEQQRFSRRTTDLQTLLVTQYNDSWLRSMLFSESQKPEVQKLVAIVIVIVATAILVYCMTVMTVFIGVAIPFCIAAFIFSYRGITREDKEILITASYFHYLAEIYLIAICVFWAAVFAEDGKSFKRVKNAPITNPDLQSLGLSATIGCALCVILLLAILFLIMFQKCYCESLSKSSKPSDSGTRDTIIIISDRF